MLNVTYEEIQITHSIKKLQKVLITQDSLPIANNRLKAKSKLPLRAYLQKDLHNLNPAIPHDRNKKHNWIICGQSSQEMS